MPPAERMTESGRARRVERSAGALVLLLGALHAIAAVVQGSMNEDGIGYLDVAAAWISGDWSAAVSATWSPLYALALVPAALDGLPLDLRIPVVHGVGFLIFVAAFLAFRVFWRELGEAARRRAAAYPGSEFVSGTWWWLAGYALFAWATLNLIEMWSVTPDMSLAALTFLAAAALLRHASTGRRRSALLFGGVLGLGYLAKPVMFPLGLAFLGIAAVAWGKGGRRSGVASVGLALAAFLFVALPWIVALSAKQGEITFGESGRLTYLRYVNDVSYPFWREPGSSRGRPEHPVPRISADPAVYAFGDSAVGGTYPPGFDPAYWYEGVEPRLEVRRQVEEAWANAGFALALVTRRLGIPLGALLLLLGMSYRGGDRAPPGRGTAAAPGGGQVAVLAMGVVGIVLYLPVLAEGRYLGAFLVLGFGGALSLVRVASDRGGKRLATIGTAVIVAGLALQVVAFNAGGAAQVLGLDVTPRGSLGFGASSGSPAPSPGVRSDDSPDLRHAGGDHANAARALLEAGVERGARIGVIGFAFDSYWAWLADLRVVAEMPDDFDSFWGAADDIRVDIERRFAEAGAGWIVAEVVPTGPLPAGWERVGDTGLALRRL